MPQYTGVNGVGVDGHPYFYGLNYSEFLRKGNKKTTFFYKKFKRIDRNAWKRNRPENCAIIYVDELPFVWPGRDYDLFDFARPDTDRKLYVLGKS